MSHFRPKNELYPLSSEQLHILLSTIRDRVYLLNHSWQFVYANETTCSLLGVSRNRIIGRFLFDFFPNFKEMPFSDAFFRAMKNRVFTTCVCEYRLGTTHLECCKINIHPAPEGLFCISRNVADKKIEFIRELHPKNAHPECPLTPREIGYPAPSGQRPY